MDHTLAKLEVQQEYDIGNTEDILQQIITWFPCVYINKFRFDRYFLHQSLKSGLLNISDNISSWKQTTGHYQV